MLWQLVRKPPNIEMIHLFSSNFLFGWMMEHCREDKLSLVEREPGGDCWQQEQET